MRGNSASERPVRTASSPADSAPRRLGRTVLIGGAGAVLLAALIGLATAKPEPITLDVQLPTPGYKRADGTLLRYNEFKETQILWGTCDGLDEIADLRGRVSVKSYQFKGRITVQETPVCIVAVVIGLDDAPMGRSFAVRYVDKPGQPRNLVIG